VASRTVFQSDFEPMMTATGASGDMDGHAESRYL
jgi:hypothetical protein